MRISWNWLGRHVDLSGLDPYAVGNSFTMSVAELDLVEEFGSTYRFVVAGRVTGLKPHPNAQNLRIVDLDIGSRTTVTLVSGAPNLEEGMLLPFAPPGVKLEGLDEPIVISAVEIRGVKSPGVVCSEKELGISDDHSGVLRLPEDTKVGTPLTEIIPINDYILHIDNTSITHRPDLWGHRGIAREIAALVNRPLTIHASALPEKQAGHGLDSVEVLCPELCPRYIAATITGLKVGPSPLWLKTQLSMVGIRPINNVVDITNFVMIDVGNPLHAFDRRFVDGDHIEIRRAGPGEEIKTLDGQLRELVHTDVLIADASKGIALAGVMGGENSQILDDTTDVVLEAACFDPSSIRRTSARLGLRTDASARFEKGLDPLAAGAAAAEFITWARRLIPSCSVVGRCFDVSAPRPEPRVIEVRPSWINRKLGTDIPPAKMRAMLENIEFVVEESTDLFKVTVPTFRATRDITIPEDIVEEIGRLYGYDNITPVPIMAPVEPPPRLVAGELAAHALDLLTGLGYQEILSYSFDSASLAASIGYNLDDALELRNPISADMPVMRRSLVPNMLASVARNALEFDEFKLFEYGLVFFTDSEGGIPHQEHHLAGVVYSREKDGFELYRQVRGEVELLLRRLNRGSVSLVMPDNLGNMPWTVPEKARSVELEGQFVGYLSLLNPVVRDRLKLRGKAVVFEINLEPVFQLPEVVPVFDPLPRFPSIEHDISVIVDMETAYDEVNNAILKRGTDLLQSCSLFAVFRGGPIPEGKKSLSFRLVFRHDERTLQTEDVEPIVAQVLAGLAADVKGEIRS